MKEKTARRFLRRNSHKIARRNCGMLRISPSAGKRIKKAAGVLLAA